MHSIFCVLLVFFLYNSSVLAAPKEVVLSLEDIRAKLDVAIKKIDFSAIKLTDYKTFASLPSPAREKEKVDMNIWSVHCPPCMLKLKQSWQDSKAIWVTIDQDPGDRIKALDWLNKNKIDIVVYHDSEDKVRKTLGKGNVTLPLSIHLQNGKVKSWALGYKSSGNYSEEVADRLMLNL